MQNNTFLFVRNKQLLYIFIKHAIYCTMDIQLIKERRNLLGLTQQDLADYTGLSLRIIKSIESGKGNPSIGTLGKIAEVLGLEIELRVKVSGK